MAFTLSVTLTMSKLHAGWDILAMHVLLSEKYWIKSLMRPIPAD